MATLHYFCYYAALYSTCNTSTNYLNKYDAKGLRAPGNHQNTLTPDKYHNLFPYDKIKNHVKTNIYTQPLYFTY